MHHKAKKQKQQYRIAMGIIAVVLLVLIALAAGLTFASGDSSAATFPTANERQN